MFTDILVWLGLSSLIGGFVIVTFITLALFFKKEVCFHEKNKLILTFELLLDICGWVFLVYMVIGVI